MPFLNFLASEYNYIRLKYNFIEVPRSLTVNFKKELSKLTHVKVADINIIYYLLIQILIY